MMHFKLAIDCNEVGALFLRLLPWLRTRRVDLFIPGPVSHPQVGEDRTALFPVLVLFWCVGGSRVRGLPTQWEMDRKREREREKWKDKYRAYKVVSAWGNLVSHSCLKLVNGTVCSPEPFHFVQSTRFYWPRSVTASLLNAHKNHLSSVLSDMIRFPPTIPRFVFLQLQHHTLACLQGIVAVRTAIIWFNLFDFHRRGGCLFGLGYWLKHCKPMAFLNR